MKRWIVAGLGAAALLAAVGLPGCMKAVGGASRSAAQKVFVKPGELDTYYSFISGGHHGNVYVYGFPSCRYITTIPVFTPEPAVGYGFDEESKAMLGGRTWGDCHHPGLSETDGAPCRHRPGRSRTEKGPRRRKAAPRAAREVRAEGERVDLQVGSGIAGGRAAVDQETTHQIGGSGGGHVCVGIRHHGVAEAGRRSVARSDCNWKPLPLLLGVPVQAPEIAQGRAVVRGFLDTTEDDHLRVRNSDRRVVVSRRRRSPRYSQQVPRVLIVRVQIPSVAPGQVPD